MKPAIVQGLRIPEPAVGKIFNWLAEGNNFRALIAIANAVANGKILVNVTMPDGSVETARGQLLISDLNSEMTVPVDLSGLQAGTGNSGIIPFIGTGPPSATTLSSASSYTATQPPSLYVDLGALTLYVCTSSGTNATSSWKQISGGGEVSAYNWGAYPPGSIVYLSPTILAGPPVTINGQVNVAGWYATINGIAAANNSNSGAILGGGHVGATNVPGWPKQNDWDLIAFYPIVLNYCTVDAFGAVTSTPYYVQARPKTF